MLMAEELDSKVLDNDGFDGQLSFGEDTFYQKYEKQIERLTEKFMPPKDEDGQKRSLHKQEMEKYADYRNYLTFSMYERVEDEHGNVKKNSVDEMAGRDSGGEGQNPLYVALLASFAQAYHINLSSAVRQRPSIRLVILDEAFSKMDAEKVASCIELIRGLGFQAIISATNDKIQNYVENVDKTFVFANPSKKSISIQAFEKDRMKDLASEMDEEA